MCLPALNFVACEHKNYCTCSNDGTRCCSVPKDLKKAGFENNVPDQISPVAMWVITFILPETSK